jgi:hypothetical protein
LFSLPLFVTKYFVTLVFCTLFLVTDVFVKNIAEIMETDFEKHSIQIIASYSGYYSFKVDGSNDGLCR